MKTTLTTIALSLTLGACTLVPEHQPLARIATIQATHNLINNGYSALTLATLELQEQVFTTNTIGQAFPADIAKTYQTHFTTIADRSKRGYDHRYPARLFQSDEIKTKLIQQWINETAQKRI